MLLKRIIRQRRRRRAAEAHRGGIGPPTVGLGIVIAGARPDGTGSRLPGIGERPHLPRPGRADDDHHRHDHQQQREAEDQFERGEAGAWGGSVGAKRGGSAAGAMKEDCKLVIANCTLQIGSLLNSHLAGRAVVFRSQI
jgi:hypothetical protein